MDSYNQKMAEALRAQIADLKQQLSAFEGNSFVSKISFWRRGDGGPLIEMKHDEIARLKRSIANEERRLAQVEKGW
jgi:hypothetical protein